MSISVIASQQAITASPLAAATVGLLGILSASGLEINGKPVELWHILAICIPSTLVGVALGALSVIRKGKALADDPIYQERVAKGLIESGETKQEEMSAPTRARRVVGGDLPLGRGAHRAVRDDPLAEADLHGRIARATRAHRAIENAILSIMDPQQPMRSIPRAELAEALEKAKEEIEDGPTTRQATLGMPTIIQILMFGAAGLMMLFLGAKPQDAVRSSVATAGVIAVIAIIGLGWMGNCFFEGNKEFVEFAGRRDPGARGSSRSGSSRSRSCSSARPRPSRP